MGTLRKLVVAALGMAVAVLIVVGVAVGVRALLDHPAGAAEVLGGAVVVLFVALVVIGKLKPTVQKGTILELDLATWPAETASTSPLAALSGGRTPTLQETIEAVQKAGRDKRVVGMVVSPRFTSAPLAGVQELSAAIAGFRAAGKPTAAIVDTFGEGGPANSAYLLAAACDQIGLHEAGLVGISPLFVEPNFYRGLLDRVGVKVQVIARYEYKNAANQLTETNFTGPHAEAQQRLLDSLWEQLVDAVAAARRLDPNQVRRLADSGPLLASEALEGGLVDRVAYSDELMSDFKRRVGRTPKLVGLGAYVKKAGKRPERGKKVRVAVVTAAGEIRTTQSLPVGMTGGPVLAADQLVLTLRKVAADKKVKALVLRIDSPGGSAIASDTIWRELVRIKDAGKPMVASMSSVAASGGYYIAAPADRIVAEPGTITGSIGVVSMHPVFGEAKAKLGIVPGELHTGAKPSSFTVNRMLTRAEAKRMDVGIDHVYDTFTGKVADGRRRPLEDIQKVARGRVWSGADAVGIGLVDDLGGLDKALSVAVELSGAAAGTKADVRTFPRKQGAMGRLRKKRPLSSEDVAAAARALAAPTGVTAHLGFDPRRYWIR